LCSHKRAGCHLLGICVPPGFDGAVLAVGSHTTVTSPFKTDWTALRSADFFMGMLQGDNKWPNSLNSSKQQCYKDVNLHPR
jgi:hypothetical protein